MKNEDLAKRLRKLGFPLFETEDVGDANLTLANLVQSKELRFWEGFPVVLATAAEKGLFDYYKTTAALEKPQDKPMLDSLVAMSLALYKDLGAKFSWSGSLYELLSSERKKEYDAFHKAFANDSDFKLGGYGMSSGRLKSVFNAYFRKERDGLHDLLSAKEEMGLEYAMSQIFSPKQKELFLKRLRGDVFTKTEKEYFSRAVKKKVLALANTDLHRLSRRLLGE